MIAYHFVGAALRDGKPIPPDGKWITRKKVALCESGLHASLHVADALKYAPGNTLCLVQMGGEIISSGDKVVASRRKIIARFDATDLLRADARASALSVIHLWKAPDIAIQYLQTGDDVLRTAARLAAHTAHTANVANVANVAAADAARAARAAAAHAAAHARAAAAHAAAYYAATNTTAAAYYATANTTANRERLKSSVDAKFKEMGVLS